MFTASYRSIFYKKICESFCEPNEVAQKDQANQETMLKPLDRLEVCIAGLEKAFNVLECIPVIASFAGSARCALGKLQIISGIAVAILAIAAAQLISNPVWRHKCQILLKHAFDHTLHGMINMIRGTAADKLFLGLPLFLSYDLMGLRFCYYGEEKEYRRIDHALILSIE